MNTEKHTVQVPLEDYLSMTAAAKHAEEKVAQFRARIIQALVDVKLNTTNPDKKEFVNQLIAAIEKVP